MNYSTKRN